MTRVIRFGVLGCADIAWRRMLPALSTIPHIEIVAIASRNLAKAQRFTAQYGGEPVLGYEALLARSDLDAVYIPLPAVLHARWIEKALLAGKNVLAEKPLTTDRDQTERLFRLAVDEGRVLMENYMFLLHSQHLRIAEELAAGAIGDIRSLSATFTIPPKPAGDIRYLADVGGGALFDIGVYPIRTALHYLGPKLEVVGAVLRISREHGVVVGGSALLATPDGATAQLRFGMEHSYCARYEIHGSDGRISLDRAFTPPPEYQPVMRIDRQDLRTETTLPADDQFGNTAQLFAEAVLVGADIRSLSESSQRQASLVEAVYRAAECRYV